MWGWVISKFAGFAGGALVKSNLFKYISIGLLLIGLGGIVWYTYNKIENLERDKILLSNKVVLKEAKLKQAYLIAEMNAEQALVIKSDYEKKLGLLKEKHISELKKAKAISKIDTVISNVKAEDDGFVSKVTVYTLDALRELQEGKKNEK